MKKLVVITLVVIMLAISVVPALAAGGPPANRGTGTGICDGSQAGYGNQTGVGNQAGLGLRTPYALSGTITAIDSTGQTVNVSIACGNRLAYPYLDQEITLSTAASTRYLLRNADGSVTPITFADLAVGQQISSHGTLLDGVWTASRITSGALLTCLSR